jgi:hypothetical protein
LANRSARIPLALVAALGGVTGYFVLVTIAMDTVSDAALVGLACVVAFVIALGLLGGGGGISKALKADRRLLAIAGLGGALAFWAAPMLALSQRATDAPSGADALFFTTSVWALACVAAAFAVRAERPLATALAGAVGAVAGAAGMLASWESPSSFSPFAKFPVREALMLVAGALFATGVIALAHSGRRADSRTALAAGLGGAAVFGLASAAFALPPVSDIGRGALMPCVYLGIALALFAFGWVEAGSAVGVSRVSVSLLVAPVAVMVLAGAERLTVARGPNPIAWPGALAGSAVVVTCAVVVWLAERRPGDATVVGPGRYSLPLGLAVAAFVASLASLATPALDAVAEGGTSVPFRAAWAMVGAESASGWLVVAAAGLALASVMVARAGASARSWVSAACAAVVCAVAAVPLRGTTLHTWNRWVPADVQQTYGTEYSRLLIEPHLEPLRVAAVVLVVASVAALAFARLTSRNGDAVSKEVA